jgi:hypothetical protein
MLKQYTIPQLAGAAAGTSSATTGVVNGEVLGLYVTYAGAGTLTVRTVHDPQVNVLVLETGGTQWYYPRAETCLDGSGTTAITYDGTYPVCAVIPVTDHMESVTNAAGTADVTVVVRQ